MVRMHGPKLFPSFHFPGVRVLPLAMIVVDSLFVLDCYLVGSPPRVQLCWRFFSGRTLLCDTMLAVWADANLGSFYVMQLVAIGI